MKSIVEISTSGTSNKHQIQSQSLMEIPNQRQVFEYAQSNQLIQNRHPVVPPLPIEESLLVSRSEVGTDDITQASIVTNKTTTIKGYYQRQKDLKSEVREVLKELGDILNKDKQ